MSDKLPAPCEHCKATGFFGGSECRECDGKGYRLIVAGRVNPRKFESSGMIHRRTQTRHAQTEAGRAHSESRVITYANRDNLQQR
jgi:DnaJ-class molecular chaperone